MTLNKPDILFIVDPARWAIYWDGYYITKSLRKWYDIELVEGAKTDIDSKLIHYHAMFIALQNNCQGYREDRPIILSWLHGSIHDPYPGIQKAFDLLPKCLPLISKIVVPCTITKNNLIEAGVKEDLIEIIPLGVDTDLFKPANKTDIRNKLNIPQGAFVIGLFQKDGIGWDEGLKPKLMKGPDVFLEVISRLYSIHPNLFVLLTGPARGFVKEGLKKIGVRFLHIKEDNYFDMPKYYQTLDLYIIPSQLEGGPKSLMESWACGVPVVSMDIGMPHDYIKYAYNGLFAKDTNDLFDKAVWMSGDWQLRKFCIENALNDVKQLDWNVIGEKYKALYEKYIS